MHCRQARDLLLLACEHELPGEDRLALTTHLDACPECGRFAVAMRYWAAAPGHYNPEHFGFVAGNVVPQRGTTPDLTERVLASVRPLPPPWVYHETQWEKRRPHVIGFAIGALAVVCAFVAVSLVLIVAFASGVTGATSHIAAEAMVGNDVHQWFDTLPRDMKHAAITLGALAVFAFLVLRWFHALALRLGDDNHTLWKS